MASEHAGSAPTPPPRGQIMEPVTHTLRGSQRGPSVRASVRPSAHARQPIHLSICPRVSRHLLRIPHADSDRFGRLKMSSALNPDGIFVRRSKLSGGLTPLFLERRNPVARANGCIWTPIWRSTSHSCARVHSYNICTKDSAEVVEEDEEDGPPRRRMKRAAG